MSPRCVSLKAWQALAWNETAVAFFAQQCPDGPWNAPPRIVRCQQAWIL